jgi:TldD protein
LKTLMLEAMNLARMRGAQYADIRVVHNRTESLSVKNGSVEAIDFAESLGFGVRVLAHGAWGFACSRDLNSNEIKRVTGLALQVARASALARGEAIDLGPAVTSQGTFSTPIQMDPFSISLETKLGALLAADAEMARVRGVRVRHGVLVFVHEQKWFANTEGAFTEQTIVETGGGIQATAVRGNMVQVRSYPAAFGRQHVAAGWEAVTGWDLPGHAPRIAGEAVALLSADLCPSEITTTVILGGDQVALQIHESAGHPAELDRVFGSEAAYAGASFLTPDKLGNFFYGSDVVNITADSLRPLGVGTFGWDEEGVPSQSTPVVKNGVFVGYLMSRDMASKLDRVSNGCMRASGWNRIPLIRMTNLSLEPGEWRWEDLIADTDEGIYMDTNRSWSIDDRRYNFQFGTEIGYEIKHGKLGRLLRNPTYTGVTPEFWSRCDAVCNAEAWSMYGTPHCGKGQPAQVVHTGHGAAPARFRNVRVGVFR